MEDELLRFKNRQKRSQNIEIELTSKAKNGVKNDFSGELFEDVRTKKICKADWLK